MNAAAQAQERIRALLDSAGVTARKIAGIPRVGEGSARASSGQRALWLAHQANPSSAYNILASFVAPEGTDADVLARAVEIVSARHEALRTRLALIDEVLIQVVEPDASPSPMRVDLTSLAVADSRAALERLVRDEAQHVFDLARAPLARALVVKLPEDRVALVVNLHHCISDGWSQEVLAREIEEAYAELKCGRRPAMAPPPIQYTDFSSWQNALLAGPEGARQLGFWREALRDAPELHGLPLDVPRSMAGSARAGRVARRLSDETEQRLRAHLRAHKTTPFCVLFGMFSAVLARFGSLDEIVIGCAHANRARPETQRLVGYLVSALPARFRFSARTDLHAAAAQVHDWTLGALANGDLPLEWLIDELGIPRSAGVHPLFQLFFSYRESTGAPLRLAESVVESSDSLKQRAPKFELSLNIESGRAGHYLTWEWNAALFSDESMHALISAFEGLLDGALREPERPIAALNVGPALEGTLRGAAFEEEPETFSARHEHWAAVRPEQLAVVDQHGELSHAALARRSTQLCASLLRCGVKPGQRVALLMERSAAAIVALLAIHRAGATCVPLDPAAPGGRIETMLDASECVLVLVTQRTAALVSELIPALCLDPLGACPDEVLLPGARAGVSDSRAPAYIVFTSGSTGTPKGALIGRENLARFLRGMEHHFGWQPGLRYSLAINLATDIGLQNAFCALAFGGTIVVVPDEATKDPARFAQFVAASPIDVAVFTPSHFCALYQPEIFGTPLPRDTLVLEGEQLTPAMLDAVRAQKWRRRVANGYGPTEATMLCCIHDVDVDATGNRAPIGVPMSEVTLRVVSSAGVDQPRHAIGELWIEGPTVGLGYCAPVPRSGFESLPTGTMRYRTGDLVRIGRGGQLEFLGRRDTQVKIRGHRIEAGEIEAALRSLLHVKASAVRCITEEKGDGRICAYVAWGDTPPRPFSAVLAALATRLPHYMLPDSVTPVDFIPVLGNGKVDYKALPAPVAPDANEVVDPPASAEEQQLAKLWSRVLHLEDIQRHSDFFACGGNSIKVIQLVTLARAAGFGLTALDVNAHPQLAAQAALLAQAAAPNRAMAPTESSGVQSVPPAAFSLLSEAERADLPAGAVDAFPLTMLQQAMVATHLGHAGRSRYLIVVRQPAPRGLQADALRAALAHVIARHEVLRTSFATASSGERIQVIHSEARTPLLVEDVRSLDSASRDALIEAHVRRRREQPLPLERAPLFAVDLFLGNDEQHVLVWTIHHAILDGWSIARLADEVARAHGRALSGTLLAEPRAPSAMASLVRRERALLDDASEASFWHDYFKGSSPAALPRLPQTVAREASVATPTAQRRLDAALVERLRAVSRSTGVSLKAVFFAAYSRVIGEMCGVSTLLTGYCMHRRDEAADSQKHLGLFVTTIPARIELNAGSWKDLMVRAHETERALWPHRFTPLPRILQIAAADRLFEHCFNFNDTHDSSSPSGVASAGVAEGTNVYLLNELALTACVSLSRAGEDGVLLLTFDPQVLDLDQTASIGELMVHALEEIARKPLAAAALLTGSLRRRVLEEWNATARAIDSDQCIHEGFLRQVRARPESVALIDERGALSYAALFVFARALADRLVAAGVAPGDRVAVILPRGRAQVAATLGVLLAGAVYVPIDPQWPLSRCEAVLKNAETSFAFASADVPLPTSFSVTRIEAGEDALVASGETLEWALDRSRPVQGPGALAYIIFTSGSTGTPKGVAMEHRAVCVTLLAVNELLEVTPDDVALATSALTFDLSVYDIFGVLGCGGRIVCPAPGRGNDPDHWLDLIFQHGVTIWNTVPSAAQMLDEAAQLSRGSPGSWALRYLLLSGDRVPPALPPRLAQRFRPVRVISLGGATEAAIWSIFYPVLEDTSNWKSVPYGRPLPNQRFYILDENRRPVVPGAAGTLHIGGDGLARGYFGDATRTAESFFFHEELQERLYCTGDIGRYLTDGNIDFIGRADGQVKIRGYRIETGDIEAAIRAFPAVSDTVVVAHDSGNGERQLLAYVVPQPGAALEKEALRLHLVGKLPAYMIPRGVVTLAALPLSANGKVDRSRLPAPEADAFERPRLTLPTTAEELELQALWKSFVPSPEIGVHDNFFELGGDSIGALRMISAWSRSGRAITLRQFYAGPTIAGMLASRDAAPVAAEIVAVGTAQPLLPAQAWLLTRENPLEVWFNQGVCIALPPLLPADTVRAALEQLVELHDVFRLTFRKVDAGWSAQYAADARHALRFTHVDLAGVEPGARGEVRSRAAEACQRGVNVSRGPLLNAALFSGDEGRCELVLIASHLVVDAVSWNTLLLDLESMLRNAGDSARVSSTGGSLQSWARYLREPSTIEHFRQQLEYWHGQLAGAPCVLPTDSSGATQIRVRIANWSDLVATVRERYAASAYETLLCLLYVGLRDWTGWKRIPVLLENHGRPVLADAPDVSQTVGWLTAFVPFALESSANSTGEVLQSLIASIRAVPDGGVGYGVLRYLAEEPLLASLPEPSISINYFGESSGDTPLGVVGSNIGPSRDPEAPPLFDLSITAIRDERDLTLTLEFDSGRVGGTDRLARALKGAAAELREAIATQENRAPASVEVAQPIVLPATGIQHGLLLQSQLDASRSAYVNQVRLRLQGQVDEQQLRRAWQRVIDRHEALRLSFRDHDGLLQLVHPTAQMPWQSIDLRSDPAEQRMVRIEALADSQRTTPLDPESPPLMRMMSVRVDDETLELIWTYHHVLLDGWSLPILLADLVAAYDDGAGSTRLAAVSQHAVQRHSEWLQARDRDAASDHWSRLLLGYEPPAPLDLGFAQGEAIECVSLELPAATNEALTLLARHAKATLNAVVQAAWVCVLSRYYQRDDIVFGATISGRPSDLPDAERMVGLFINTVPVRARLSTDTTGEQLISALFAQQSDSAEHGFLPLVQIQAACGARSASGLFETAIVFENYHVTAAATSQAALRVTQLAYDERPHYPLTLVVAPGAELRLRLHFRSDRFSTQSARRLLAHMRRALEHLAANPAAPIAQLALLSDDERAALQLATRRQRFALDVDRLDHAFDRTASAHPDSIALIDGERTLTYADLQCDVNRVAGYLVASGATGHHVALCLRGGVDQLVAILGILKSGATYVPIDPALPLARRDFLLKDAECTHLLCEAEMRAEVPSGVTATTMADARAANAALVSPAAPSEDAYIIYTSGTTGTPKGVVVTHRNVLRLFAATDKYFAFGPRDVWSLFHSVGFDFSVWEMWGAWLYGGTLVVVPQDTARDPQRLLELLARTRVSVFSITPSAFRPLDRQDQEDGGAALLALRYVVFGGERLDSVALRAWAERRGLQTPRLVNMYGITETTVHTTLHEITESDLTRGRSPIGRPLADLSIHLLDGAGRDVPVGVAGEIHIAGDGVSRGYYRRPELTAERFIQRGADADRVYRSGDLARWTETHELEYVGRKDGQLKVRGYRIERGEIESQLRVTAGVADAAVIVSGTSSESTLVAYVVPAAPQPDSAELIRILRTTLASQLPPHCVPSQFVVLDRLPVNRNGKLDYGALPPPPLQQEAQNRGTWSTHEQVVAGIWSEVLDVPVTSADQDFFELGGHSLKMGRVIARLRAAFDVELKIGDLFARTTVADQAAYIRSLTSVKQAPLQAVELSVRRAGVKLTPQQSGLWYLCQDPALNEAYNIPLLVELRGAVNIPALSAALTTLTQRHESLRSVARTRQQDTLLAVLEHSTHTVEVIPAVTEEDARSKAQAILRHRFDWRTESLFMARVIPLDGARCWLAINIHHLICDVWSIGVLLRELQALYQRQLDPGVSELAPLPIQLGDYAAWLSSPDHAGQQKRSLQYWTQRLADYPGVLALQTDRPLGSHSSFQGDAVAFRWPTKSAETIRDVCSRRQLTPFMLFLSAYALLISRLAGTDDVVIGALHAGRERVETEGLIGLLATMLPMRVNAADEQTVAHFLHQVKADSLAAFEHSSVPLDRIVEAAGVRRTQDRRPLVQVAFTLQNVPQEQALTPDIGLTVLPVSRRTAKFDLSLTLHEGRNGYGGELEYDCALFERETVVALTRYLMHIVQQLCSEESLADILLTDEQGVT